MKHNKPPTLCSVEPLNLLPCWMNDDAFITDSSTRHRKTPSLSESLNPSIPSPGRTPARCFKWDRHKLPKGANIRTLLGETIPQPLRFPNVARKQAIVLQEKHQGQELLTKIRGKVKAQAARSWVEPMQGPGPLFHEGLPITTHATPQNSPGKTKHLHIEPASPEDIKYFKEE